VADGDAEVVGLDVGAGLDAGVDDGSEVGVGD
jgi:hypothetical protein